MQPHPNSKVAIPVAIVLVALFVAGAVWIARAEKYVPTPTLPPVQFPSGPAVYYQISHNNADPQGLNSYDIYRRTVKGQQNHIATVSDETRDKRPTFLLANDSTLITSFPDKVFSINTHTGEKTLIYTATYEIRDTSLSSDKSKLLFWDGELTAVDPERYIATTYTLATQVSSLIGRGTFEEGTGFGGGVWNREGTSVSFSQSTTDYRTEFWEFNLKTNRLTDTTIYQYPYSLVNDDGTLQAVAGSLINDAVTALCPGPYMVAPSDYSFQNKSRVVLSTFSIPGKQVIAEQFSPDSKKLLVGVLDMPSKEADCNNTTPTSYYVIDTDGTKLHQVDYEQQLTTWKFPIPATIVYDSVAQDYSILFGSKKLYTTKMTNNEGIFTIGAVQ